MDHYKITRYDEDGNFVDRRHVCMHGGELFFVTDGEQGDSSPMQDEDPSEETNWTDTSDTSHCFVRHNLNLEEYVKELNEEADAIREHDNMPVHTQDEIATMDYLFATGMLEVFKNQLEPNPVVKQEVAQEVAQEFPQEVAQEVAQEEMVQEVKKEAEEEMMQEVKQEVMQEIKEEVKEEPDETTDFSYDNIEWLSVEKWEPESELDEEIPATPPFNFDKFM